MELEESPVFTPLLAQMDATVALSTWLTLTVTGQQ